jgi:transcriptional regulator GlxA family with amidase domain
MQERVSHAATRTEPSLRTSKALARSGAGLAWDEEALKTWRRFMHMEAAKRCMRRVVDLLRVDPWFAKVIAEFEMATRLQSKPTRGGLASWQIQRVTTHIEADLAAKVRIRDLAELIELSASHFSRAFKLSFADTPHRYLMRRRVEFAKVLMLATKTSLGRIAADCGFADQPHFNRHFRRLVGENPNAWRRARARTLHTKID